MTKKVRQIRSLSDPGYFESIFKEYFKPLTYYAVRFTRDEDSAREIVHTVFINIWEKRDTFSLDQAIKPYLYTAVHNRSLNYLRDRAKFHGRDSSELESIIEPNVSDQNVIESAETEATINEAINRLPERCRIIFKLNRFEEKKYSEIASQLNISVKTVEGQISKALRILREELKYLLIMIIWITTKIFF